MAKPNKPTAENVRQGQTIYLAWVCEYNSHMIKVYVSSFFLQSHKVPIPDPGEISRRMPVSKARELLGRHNRNVFFSRGKAEKRAAQLKRQIMMERKSRETK